MPMEGYGPYEGTFVGGLLDGEKRQVGALSPDQIVFHDDPRQRPHVWSGKPMPRRPYDVYDLTTYDYQASICTYTYSRTVT